jgi:uroporphyrinogen decarboxylase
MHKKYPFINSITPDGDDLVQVLFRRGKRKGLHFLELFLDDEIKDELWERLDLEAAADDPYNLGKEIILHRALGYEVFRVPVVRKSMFNVSQNKAGDDRNWMEEHQGPVRSWEDFESFPWPEVKSLDLGPLDWMEKNVPEGMGCFDLTAHIFEIVSFLFGFETLCIKLHDDPPLVEAAAEKVGEFYIDYSKTLADYSCVPLLWSADDLGFKSSLLVPPDTLRRIVLPWHKKCAEIAHRAGKPYLLHSCGNVEEIMEDLIEDVQIDGKHSFEDEIMPVTEASRRYGGRIAIIGGIDVDFLVRSEEREIRKRVRETLDVCTKVPGYCFGTGNSVTNYTPVENYLIMLDEAAKYAGAQ